MFYQTSMPRPAHRTRTKVRRLKHATATPALEAFIAAGHSAAQHRKGRSLPTDLAAPITGEIERQLEQLIRTFGANKVRDALTPLVAKCKWDDWLCVANAIDRLVRKVRPRRVKASTKKRGL